MDSTNYKISVVKNTVFPSNTYIIKYLADDTCIIVDPGLDTAAIENALVESNAKPLAILATHGHFDHIGSVKHFQDTFQIPYYLHEKDLKLSQSANFYLKMAKLNHKIQIPVPDHLFKNDEENIVIGNFKFDVYSYPGHSYGSCILKCDNNLFSGDIMYKKGLGFNNFPGENKAKLRESIIDIMNRFNDESLMLPGHGEAVLLKEIKNNNKELMDFITTNE